MPNKIEFWFDFSSPYAYFASLEIDQRFARFGIPILWRPYLLGVAFKKTGMQSLSRSPMRGDYARYDWQRIADWNGVSFKLREDHPFPSQTLARTYYWLAIQDQDQAVKLAKAAFHHYFGEGLSLRSSKDVFELAERYTDQLDSLQHWLCTDDAKQVLRDRTSEAIDKGVFGSPYILVDKEPFWGWDRLPMIEEWLERHQRG